MLKEFGMNHFCGMDLLSPKIGFFIDCIDDGISFAKINHSFWEMLSGDHYWIDVFLKRHGKNFINEVKFIIKNIDKTNIKFAVSCKGPPSYSKNNLHSTIKKHLPDNYIPYYAFCWKSFALDNSLKLFFEKIKNKKIVLVGLNHIGELSKTFSFTDCFHYCLSMDSCYEKERLKVLDDLKTLAETKSEKIFIFQAGEIFSTWLIYNLNKLNIQKNSYIDMGRSIDIYCPNKKLTLKDKNLYPFSIESFMNQPWMKKS